MTEREKVIKGLECCLEDEARDLKCWEDGDYPECPYNDRVDGCMGRLNRDALALLKAQEPRVMTLEEVKMLDRDYYYLEAMRSPGKELREIVGAYGLECVTWPSITWARQTMGDRGYGKTWRCWTSRPTDEQREAVKWG